MPLDQQGNELIHNSKSWAKSAQFQKSLFVIFGLCNYELEIDNQIIMPQDARIMSA